MGWPADLFGWFTLAWAGNFVVASLVSSRLQGRVKSLLLIPIGQGILTVGAVAMMATAWFGLVTPLALIVPVILMGWGNGLNMPNAIANALASVPANPGRRGLGAAGRLLFAYDAVEYRAWCCRDRYRGAGGRWCSGRPAPRGRASLRACSRDAPRLRRSPS